MKLLALAFFATGFLVSPVSAQKFPTFAGKPVIDDADVLPPAIEEELNRKLIAFKAKTRGEVAVVTVHSLDGHDIEGYANRLFRTLGVGHRDLDNGVLLLVAPNDRKMRIEVGYGLGSRLTDAQSGRIIRNVIAPEFKKGRLPEGIVQGVDAILPLATPPTAEEIEEQKRMVEAEATRSAAAFNSFLNFLAIAAGLATVVSGIVWFYFLATRKKRAALRAAAMAQAEAEQAARIKRAAAARAEAEAARQREIDAVRRARENKLAAMTPSQRADFLESERQAHITAQKARAKRNREEAVRREAQRKRDAEAARRAPTRSASADETRPSGSSWDTTSSPSSSTSSSSDSFSFGGGDSGGGGASGDW